MEALKLTRKVYDEGLEKINSAAVGDTAYLDQFEIELEDGLNTASVMEICRVIQDSSFEGKMPERRSREIQTLERRGQYRGL